MMEILFNNVTSTESTTLGTFGDNTSLEADITPSQDDTTFTVILGVVLITIIIGTTIGNVLVIAAILMEKNLQKASNYLVVSLAVADLMIGLMVMPFGVYDELNKGWNLGPELCDFWRTNDILHCTASILNIVAIAFDRYCAVTKGVNSPTKKRVLATIIAAWSVSLVEAVAPLFGWMDPGHVDRIVNHHICIPSVDLSYQMLSYLTALYIPLPVILFFYWKIYQTARNSFRWKKKQKAALEKLRKKGEGFEETSFRKSKNFNKMVRKEVVECNSERSTDSTVPFEDPTSSSTGCARNYDTDSRTTNDEILSLSSTTISTTANNQDTIQVDYIHDKALSANHETTMGHEIGFKPPHQKAKGSISILARYKLQSSGKHSEKKYESRYQQIKRENKTTKILSIITGAFILCWLPYFLMDFLWTRFDIEVPHLLRTFSVWLSYFNSTINPIIYTMFSEEFRLAFKNMVLRMRCNQRTNLQ